MWETHNTHLVNFDVTALRYLVMSGRALGFIGAASSTTVWSNTGRTRERQFWLKRFPGCLPREFSLHLSGLEGPFRPERAGKTQTGVASSLSPS
jgi:hypothetical protein